MAIWTMLQSIMGFSTLQGGRPVIHQGPTLLMNRTQEVMMSSTGIGESIKNHPFTRGSGKKIYQWLVHKNCCSNLLMLKNSYCLLFGSGLYLCGQRLQGIAIATPVLMLRPRLLPSPPPTTAFTDQTFLQNMLCNNSLQHFRLSPYFHTIIFFL